jgi:hypothetical protein
MRLAIALCLISSSALAQGEGEPLSAIDWLSRSVDIPEPAAVPNRLAEPETSESATAPAIVVTPLDNSSPDLVGLLPPSVTGLPMSLWSGSTEAVLTDLVRAESIVSLPAIQDLLTTLMLAEADPPQMATAQGPLFLARVDKLLDLGALDPAAALLEAANLQSPPLFQRYFDISLLLGTEDGACRLMRNGPAIAPTLPARVFCLAREGDWTAAALTLNTAIALGDVSPEEEQLLTLFLDPELAEGLDPLPPPDRPSPLIFRIREAIGEGFTTAPLPLAFAHADLRDTTAWRSRMEAAERLTRTGALSENVLQDLYTEQRPAASGGVWDRAAAFQRFDAAMAAEDATALAATLPPVWDAMEVARTEVAFARLYGDKLMAMSLPDEAGRVALRVALLAPEYETAALTMTPENAHQRIWIGVARGDVTGLTSNDPRESAVIAAFSGTPIPEALAAHLQEGRLGEALLRAIATFQQGLTGDPQAVADALAVFRIVGLEDTARRAALQYLILDRPT